MIGRPRLSVVIPTRDRHDFLHTCLEGFADPSADREAFEVVVVDDDGSTSPLDDVIADTGRGMDLRVEYRPGDGVAAARKQIATYVAGMQRAVEHAQALG